MRADLFDLHARIEGSHWWFRGRRRILGALGAAVLPPPPDPLIIDIGCGTGANLAAFEGYRRLGVDDSAEAVRLAARRFPDVRFVHGRAPEDIPHALGEAGLVLLTDVLEHIQDDRAALAGIVARMRPGAHLLLTVPSEMRLWSEHDVSFGHFRRYEIPELRALWAGLPVRARLVSAFNARLYPLVRAARAVGRRLARATGAGGTDFSTPPAPLNRMLERIFAGEAAALVRAVDGDAPAYRRGVSLVALLRREPDAESPE